MSLYNNREGLTSADYQWPDLISWGVIVPSIPSVEMEYQSDCRLLGFIRLVRILEGDMASVGLVTGQLPQHLYAGNRHGSRNAYPVSGNAAPVCSAYL